MKRKRQNNKQYYRLLDSQALPEIVKPSLRYSQPTSPEKTVERIVKSQHFVYIDMDQESGCRIMDKQTPKTQEEDVEKIGNSYIWNLKNLSTRNQQTIDYLSKLQQSQQQKQSMRRVFQKQLQRSISKINKRKKYKLDYSQLKQKRKLQFDPMKLRELVQADHLESINHSIWLKQKRLIEKLGIEDHNFISSATSPDNKGKNFSNPRLPQINYRTIQR